MELRITTLMVSRLILNLRSADTMNKHPTRRFAWLVWLNGVYYI